MPRLLGKNIFSDELMQLDHHLGINRPEVKPAHMETNGHMDCLCFRYLALTVGQDGRGTHLTDGMRHRP